MLDDISIVGSVMPKSFNVTLAAKYLRTSETYIYNKINTGEIKSYQKKYFNKNTGDWSFITVIAAKELERFKKEETKKCPVCGGDILQAIMGQAAAQWLASWKLKES